MLPLRWLLHSKEFDRMIDDQIKSVLTEHAKLSVDVSSLTAETDLYQAGLTSHASVNVMLALEDEFDIEFPDAMLKKATFASVEAIRTAIEQIRDDA